METQMIVITSFGEASLTFFTFMVSRWNDLTIDLMHAAENSLTYLVEARCVEHLVEQGV